MIKVNVLVANISWKKYIKNPHKYLKAKIKKIDLSNKIFRKKRVSFSILLAGNKHIKNLNNKFRKKNKSTDVLSFPFQTKKELSALLKKEKEIYLGDIIININKINYTNLENFKTDFDRLWIHGFVHLFGYDHKKENDFLKMSQVEKKYINFINA